MLTSGVVLLHDSARANTATRARTLLKHFNWELFDHPPYSPDLAPNYYHLFTYLKNWLESQPFRNNKELMKGVKTCLSSQAASLFDIGMQILFPYVTSASIPPVTAFRSSLNMYIFLLYIINYFSRCLFC
jgi:hypothetical protein